MGGVQVRNTPLHALLSREAGILKHHEGVGDVISVSAARIYFTTWGAGEPKVSVCQCLDNISNGNARDKSILTIFVYSTHPSIQLAYVADAGHTDVRVLTLPAAASKRSPTVHFRQHRVNIARRQLHLYLGL